MKYTHIIWDFNGTIIDDIELTLNSINKVLARRSLPEITSVEHYRSVFCFPIEKHYANLGMDFEKEPYKIPADEWVELYTNGIDTIPLSDGVLNVIDEIYNKRIPQIILSASERSMLISQLDGLGILDKFDIVLGTDNVYGGGKVEMAKKWASGAGIDLSGAVFIGDTDHDYETAKAIGCKCILYSGGHMDKARLSRLGVPVIDKMSELLEIL